MDNGGVVDERGHYAEQEYAVTNYNVDYDINYDSDYYYNEDYKDGDYMGDFLFEYYADYFGLHFPEKDAADFIYVYVSPFLLLLGSVGNFLSLLVMYRLSQRVLSTCIYLCLLAPVDLLVLYTRCGNEWLRRVSHHDLSNVLMLSSESVCKVYPFVFNFLFHLSKWLMVCVAVEGLIGSRYPERVEHMCSLFRAKAIVLLLTVLLVCVNIHYFWSFELILIQEAGQYFCTFAKHGHGHSELFQEVIWPVLDILVSEILPLFTIITCVCFMSREIYRGRHRGDSEHQIWRRRYQLHPAAMDQIKVCILVVCIHFVLLTLPKFLYVILNHFIDRYNLVEFSFQLEAQQMLAKCICDTLEFIFLSTKFVLYFCSSTHFREQCYDLFCQCNSCCCCKKNTKSQQLIQNEPIYSPHLYCQTQQT